MKIIDISRGLLTSPIYPGDPKPAIRKISSIDDGAQCNVSAIFSCVHTGTHIDAPVHYITKTASIERLKLEPYIGECSVVTTGGVITGAEMEEIIDASKSRILLRSKGTAKLSESAAYVLASAGVMLIGTDSLSVAAGADERKVHSLLLGAEVGIIESLMLDGVYDGDYFLFAPPILIEGSDGAPARAVLMDFNN